jgi:ubiquinone/menaquinone biosynthesis C-methylase UbiE
MLTGNMSYHRYTIDPQRRNWQNPEEILAKINLKEGDSFVDIGCGSGFFALPAARKVGEKGKVYGVDLDELSLIELKNLAGREGLTNMTLTAGKAENVIPCKTCADVVFFGMALHDFAEPSKVLENAKLILKRNGRLVNLDWKKEPMKIGPPLHIKFSEEQAMKLIEAATFKIESVENIGLYHYIIIAGL